MTATAREAVAALTAQVVADTLAAYPRAELAPGDAAPTLAAWAAAAGIGVGRLRYLRQTHPALRALEIRGSGARAGQPATTAKARTARAASRATATKSATKKQRKPR